MSYIDDHLMHGEHVVCRTRLHWAVFLWPAIWFLVAGLSIQTGGAGAAAFGVLLLVFVVFPTAVAAFIRKISSEFAVTNKRVLIKTGLLGRETFETLLSKVESVHVHQGVLARLLGYGTIIFRGTGGSENVFGKIDHPMDFTRHVLEQIP